MVEGRDLVDLGKREAHFPGERSEVRGAEVAVAVLDAVQVLDQQVAAARRHAGLPAFFLEQRLNLSQRLGIDLPALQRAARPPLPRGLAALRCSIVHSLRFYRRASMTRP